MATLNQILYNVKNMYGGGTTPSDMPFSDLQIIHWIDVYSQPLRIQEIEKRGIIEAYDMIDLGCLTVTKVDMADCPIKSWGDDVWLAELPDMLSLKTLNPLSFFGLIDKVTPIPLIKAEIASIYKNTRFKGNTGYVAYGVGNKYYINGDMTKKLCVVNARGAFATPSEVRTCANIGDVATCMDWDCPYPIGEDVLPALYQILLNLLNGKDAQAAMVRESMQGGDILKAV